MSKLKEDIQDIEIQEYASKNNSKIYFFVIAIAALLATNVYFFVKYYSSDDELYTVTLQRDDLQLELDKIESDFELVSKKGSDHGLQMEKTEIQSAISDLRQELNATDLSSKGVQNSKHRINVLREKLASLSAVVDELELQKEEAIKVTENLDSSLVSAKQNVDDLKSKNRVIESRLVNASSLKASNISLAGINVSKRTKSINLTTRAKRVSQLQINFSIVDNPLAAKGKKEIFVRIINPYGNLIANTDDIFYVHGEKLQYTFKRDIDFTNNGQEYQFLWGNDESHGFRKGAYTVLIYADNSIMGRSNIVFK